ncbi:hypothetical protein [Thiocystis violacea]|uniref:hypothetical protein n=1 Tax=Thiocystis violacea TaxID=13725 RepID=UPI0019081105|nr:hypothetical protein [Thiocystis violacea]
MPPFRSSLHPASQGGGSPRLVLFVADPSLSARLRRDRGAAPGAPWAEGLDAGILALLAEQAKAEIEVIDTGGLSPGGADSGSRMDRHRLDVALSVGRHAAERAKLAGCPRLTCLGLGGEEGAGARVGMRPPGSEGPGRWGREAGSVDWDWPMILDEPELLDWLDPSSAWRAPVRRDRFYRALRRLGRFDIAALVGAMVACAQMGIGSRPLGPRARIAGWIAMGLHRGVGDWLLVPGEDGSFRSKVRPPDVDREWGPVARSPMVESWLDVVG